MLGLIGYRCKFKADTALLMLNLNVRLFVQFSRRCQLSLPDEFNIVQANNALAAGICRKSLLQKICKDWVSTAARWSLELTKASYKINMPLIK